MTSDKLNTIIVTCDRGAQNYLYATERALLEQGIVPDFMHGSLTEGNLNSLPLQMRHDQRGTIYKLEEASKPGFMEMDIRHRHNRNYADAFLRGDAKKDYLILEDDVICCKNLQEQLKAVYWLIEQRKLDDYIIALYSFAKWPLGAQNLHEYPIDKFFGLQAMLYSGSVCQDFHDAHYEMCDKEPADFITRIVAKSIGIPIHATTFSLFQHIGQITTGLGNFHQTSNFLDGTN